MPGAPGIPLRAGCRLRGIPAWEAMSLSSSLHPNNLGAALTSTFPWYMYGAGKVEAELVSGAVPSPSRCHQDVSLGRCWG